MSARPVHVKLSFDPSKVTIVRRALTSNGRHYDRGEKFDWRKLMITPRRARQLYDAGYLFHPVADSAPTEPAVESTPDPVANEVGAETDDLEDMTVKDLRSLAKDMGVRTSGNKSDVIAAIEAAREED